MGTYPVNFPLKLYDNPAVRKLNVCQAGLFRLLIERYWKTGIPLPENDYALVRLCNGDYRTFRKYGKSVKEVIKEVMPLFEKARTQKMKVKVVFQNNAARARTKLKYKNQDNNKTFSDIESTHVEINAVPPVSGKNQYHQGQFDPIAVKNAKKNNETGKTALFYDK